jgi:hypothetical protein
VLGTTIGNYQITALLGEGGMGKVYVAQHPTLARKSAIKVLHADQARDPVALSRFFNEAKSADSIRHPNIVEIYDYGTLPDGAPYIVMEYLDGETLADRLARAPLTLGETLEVVAQTASALGAAHAKEVLHRDLKPDNIFLVDDAAVPGGVRVKIVDFGIAKLQNQLTEVSHRTRTGALIGTPLYMSPEQCLGERDVGPPSDLYSLAVIAYELLCGRPPFEAEAVGGLINMHVNEPVLSPRKLNARLPRALEALLLKALSKMPANRHPNMEALLADLERVRALVERDPEVANATPARRAGSPLDAVTAVPVSTITGSARNRPTPQPEPGRARKALVGVLTASAVAAVGMFWLSHQGRAPQGPMVLRAPATPVAAPVAETPAETQLAIQLESEPSGAAVSVDGKRLGVTPMVWNTRPAADTVELLFVREGYRPETIHAVAAPGLRRVRARLEPRPAGKKPATRRAPVPADDIKSER